MAKTPSGTVQAGYDAIAARYLTWAAETKGEPTKRFLREFMSRLPVGSGVLDLGCGAGVPVTRALSKRFKVVGVDLSESQLALARANVPGAEFIHRDMAEVEFAASSWPGIVALSSITHLPRECHEEFFRRIAHWLMPGGLLFTSLGATAAPNATSEWLGVQMFYASYDADTNRALLKSAGLDPIRDQVAVTTAPCGSTGPELWLIARKRVEAAAPETRSAGEGGERAGRLSADSEPTNEDEHSG